MGKFYETGEGGVGVDLGEALRWHLRGAEKNHPWAMSQACRLYETGGKGLLKNEKKAFE